MSPARFILAFTHATVFAVGFFTGKQMDAMELAQYRSVYEKASDRRRRYLFNSTIAVASLGLLLVGIRGVAVTRRRNVVVLE